MAILKGEKGWQQISVKLDNFILFPFCFSAAAGVFAQQKHRTADELLVDFSLDSLRTAIQRFQEFAGLPKTGELDNRTRKKMKQPRCGMQDVEMMSSAGGGAKWKTEFCK